MKPMDLLDIDEHSRDELMMKQQREIEKEISDSNPLVSAKMSLDSLLAEYKDDPVFTAKILILAGKYNFMRRTRPDGNCFFRALAYSFLESLITNKNAYDKFRQMAVDSKEKLQALGFPSFTLEDFHETFMDVIEQVNPENDGGAEKIKQDFHVLFNEQDYSDYVIVYLRYITSGKLQEEAKFYMQFLDGNLTMEEFRHLEVEPMFRESDHIHIIALCTAIGVGVRVECLDRGDGSTVTTHDFPDGIPPSVFLIYKPGHYDIIYPKDLSD